MELCSAGGTLGVDFSGVIGVLDSPCMAHCTVKSNLGITPAAPPSTLIHFEIPLALEQFH